jgi:hypothetical protein
MYFGALSKEEITQIDASPPPQKFESDQILSCLPFEDLHAWLLGIPKRICEFVVPLLKLNDASRVRSESMTKTAAIKEYNRRVSLFVSSKVKLVSGAIRSIPSFRRGAAKTAGLVANDFRFLSQMLIGVFMDVETFFKPSFGRSFFNVLVRTQKIGTLLYDGLYWSKAKRDKYAIAVDDLGQMFYDVFHRVSKSKCSFIKTHAIGFHIDEDIAEYGTKEVFSAGTFESGHKFFVRKMFDTTNAAKSGLTELRMMRNTQRHMLVEDTVSFLLTNEETGFESKIIPEVLPNDSDESTIRLFSVYGSAISKFK